MQDSVDGGQQAHRLELPPPSRSFIISAMSEPNSSRRLPSFLQWTLPGRAVVFLLSAASIWCLLAEFYGLCPMKTFSLFILAPASVALVAMAVANRISGDRILWRAVVIGATAGFVAACAYDVFRLPWVIGAADQVGPAWLRLPLFKVFPRFGAMLLGVDFTPAQTDSQFSLAAHLLGWAYHFSNGMSFGVMYLSLVGSASRRSWTWAIALAAFLELAMLFTPYTAHFAIRVTALFVAVTLIAHVIFGAALGICARWWERRWAPAHLTLGN